MRNKEGGEGRGGEKEKETKANQKTQTTVTKENKPPKQNLTPKPENPGNKHTAIPSSSVFPGSTAPLDS